MADQDNPHFNKIYWYCILITVTGLAYIFCVTFMDVPKENQGTVNIVIGFVLGTLCTSAIGYLLGGNPTAAKKTSLLPEDSTTTIKATTVSADKGSGTAGDTATTTITDIK